MVAFKPLGSHPLGGTPVDSGVDVQVSLATLTLSTHSATVVSGGGVLAGVANLTFTPQVPVVTTGKGVIVSTASMTLTTHSATVGAGASVNPTVGQMTLTTHKPTVTSGVGVVVGNVAALTATAHTALVGTAAVVSVDNTPEIEFTTHEASLVSGGGAIVGVASLTFTTHKPVVITGSGVHVDVAALTFTAHNAHVNPDMDISVRTAEMVFTAHPITIPKPVYLDIDTAAITISAHNPKIVIGKLPKVQAEAQRFSAGNLITLFEVDATAIGGEYMRFTASVGENNQPIRFGGHEYFPTDIEADGFEVNGRGTLPTPIIRINNAVKVLQAGVVTLEDLLGATVYRIRTFRDFLDDGIDPDPEAKFPVDIFKIERKVGQNKVYIEFELSAAMDQEGRMIPGRQIIRDYCTHIYRVWNPVTEEFDYSKATCPYAGFGNYDENNTPCNPAQDRCGKRTSSCKMRFGENNQLPTRAFPGVARY